MIPRCLHALPPAAYAAQVLKRATRSGRPEAIAAAEARVNFHRGMIPQRGITRAAWVAWHRQSGIAGFGNRTARANEFPLRSVEPTPTVET